MSDCGTVTKRAAALQKWKLKLDEKIEWMRKKEEALPLGLSQQSIYHGEEELVYYGASLVITATAPKQGDRLDPALPAL